MWADTKRTLLPDLYSGKDTVVQNAVYTFIALGKEEVIPELIDTLRRQGNKNMAETYLHCGDTRLSDAARDGHAGGGMRSLAGRALARCVGARGSSGKGNRSVPGAVSVGQTIGICSGSPIGAADA